MLIVKPIQIEVYPANWEEFVKGLIEVSSLKNEILDVIGELISNRYGAIEVNKTFKDGTLKKEALNKFMKRVLGSIDQ